MSSTAFKVYGPFEIENKQKIYDREYQKTFWSECVEDEQDNYQLSLAKGIYLFSLRNATNYCPQYVGMTARDFRTEVFNDRNLLRIIVTKLANERGVLLLTSPSEAKGNTKRIFEGRRSQRTILDRGFYSTNVPY